MKYRRGSEAQGLVVSESIVRGPVVCPAQGFSFFPLSVICLCLTRTAGLPW